LVSLRKRRNISQEELGFQADFDRTYISLLERGIQSPTIRTVVRLAEILQVRPSIIVRQMERVLAADTEKPKASSKLERGRSKD
jgi:transcriptional regulator with XRE-family HTH domain